MSGGASWRLYRRWRSGSREALSGLYPGGPALSGDSKGPGQELRAHGPLEHGGGGHRRSAVLGLGISGPRRVAPVMEGKCVLFKAFGGVDAVPLCIRSQQVDDIVNTVALLAGSFGGVNLRISPPPLLRGRTAAQGALRDPGIPRRSARHRHAGRSPDKRAEADGKKN